LAHPQQIDYFKSVKSRFPQYFRNVDVLDVGSLDINGNNRYLFENYKYTGIDIGEGRNVDIVCRGHEFKRDKPFDVVISSECFEHDEFWVFTITNMINLLKPGGLMLFSCATTGRPEHGTRRTTPQDSPFTSKIENDYYMNVTASMVLNSVNIEGNFSQFEFFTRQTWPQDLYFFGIKNL